jgi:hypothetical protein
MPFDFERMCTLLGLAVPKLSVCGFAKLRSKQGNGRAIEMDMMLRRR